MLVFGNVAPSVKCILFWSTSGMNGFVLIHRRNLYLMHPVKDKRPQTQEEFVLFSWPLLFEARGYLTKNRVYTYKGLAIPPASPSGRISIINASCMLCAMLSSIKSQENSVMSSQPLDTGKFLLSSLFVDLQPSIFIATTAKPTLKYGDPFASQRIRPRHQSTGETKNPSSFFGKAEIFPASMFLLGQSWQFLKKKHPQILRHFWVIFLATR